MKKFCIINFGCKLNIYEAESIGYILLNNGYVKADSFMDSDVVVINTCTVTTKADSKCRNVIRKVKREHPECCLVVCGCLVDTDRENLHLLHEIDILIENKNKDKILDAIESYNQGLLKQKPFLFSSDEDGTFNFTTADMNTHSRAFIKIQDGCNNFCSYCKIPYARGGSRSRPVDDIIRDVYSVIVNGYHELVITGINIGDYCYNGLTFSGLLKNILDISTDLRIRLSSLEPQNIDSEFFDVIKDERICQHFHIALQSGSDKVLKLMNRKYDTEYFKSVIERIRLVRQDSFISTDLILGFPGETDEDFILTKKLIDEIGFSFIHLFSFSPRLGTKAYEMQPKVPERIRDERVEEIGKINSIYNKNYINSCIGKTYDLLIDKTVTNDGFRKGKTENYLDVFVKDDNVERKKIYRVKLTHIDERNRLIGELF